MDFWRNNAANIIFRFAAKSSAWRKSMLRNHRLKIGSNAIKTLKGEPNNLCKVCRQENMFVVEIILIMINNYPSNFLTDCKFPGIIVPFLSPISSQKKLLQLDDTPVKIRI
jgi:hypothetical protein